jgi:hypothetical protein
MKLTSTQDAIMQAIEGGLREGEKWKFVSANRYWVVWLDGNGNETTISVLNYFTDPIFWQALASVRQWRICINGCFPGGHDYCGGLHTPQWESEAIKWFQTRLWNGDENKFWESLP